MSNGNEWFEDADLVFSYSRKQAMIDGVLVDCSNADFGDLVRRLGIRINVAMTAGAWDTAIGALDEPLPPGQTIERRLWDVLYAFRYAMSLGGMDTDRVHFQVSVAGENRDRRTVRMWALIGPGDQGEPVITIMLEGED